MEPRRFTLAMVDCPVVMGSITVFSLFLVSEAGPVSGIDIYSILVEGVLGFSLLFAIVYWTVGVLFCATLEGLNMNRWWSYTSAGGFVVFSIGCLLTDVG